MVAKALHKVLLLVRVSWVLMICFVGASGESYATGQLYKINTQYTRLIFSSRKDVATFNKSIAFPTKKTLSGLFSGSSSEHIERELPRKVDLLFEKVQQILDMRKPMRKVRVRIYKNNAELQKAYRKIFKRKGNVRGWYVYEYNTVFLNVKDVHAGMLAHELGHAIIDHYLEVRPPRATAEILARYVDEHLFEEVRRY